MRFLFPLFLVLLLAGCARPLEPRHASRFPLDGGGGDEGGGGAPPSSPTAFWDGVYDYDISNVKVWLPNQYLPTLQPSTLAIDRGAVSGSYEGVSFVATVLESVTQQRDGLGWIHAAATCALSSDPTTIFHFALRRYVFDDGTLSAGIFAPDSLGSRLFLPGDTLRVFGEWWNPALLPPGGAPSVSVP